MTALSAAALLLLTLPASAYDSPWGFIDKTGKLVIPAKYPYASHFSKDHLVVQEPGQGVGLIDRAGKSVTAFDFQMIDKLTPDGLAVAKKNGRYGFIDGLGKPVLPFIFDYASNFSEGLGAVKRGTVYGFIDKTGKMIVVPKFYAVGKFSEGLAMAALNKDKRGYIDKTGTEVIAPRFESAADFSEGLAAAAVKTEAGKKLYGFIDKKGNWVIEPRFDYALGFSEGIAHVSKPDNTDWMFIDKTGAVVAGPSKDFNTQGSHSNFSSGLIAVQRAEPGNWKCGFIGRTGTFAFPQTSGFCNAFSEGLAAVEKERAWGFIDTKGHWVIPPQYPKVWDFHHGLAAVQVGPIPSEEDEEY